MFTTSTLPRPLLRPSPPIDLAGSIKNHGGESASSGAAVDVRAKPASEKTSTTPTPAPLLLLLRILILGGVDVHVGRNLDASMNPRTPTPHRFGSCVGVDVSADLEASNYDETPTPPPSRAPSCILSSSMIWTGMQFKTSGAGTPTPDTTDQANAGGQQGDDRSRGAAVPRVAPCTICMRLAVSRATCLAGGPFHQTGLASLHALPCTREARGLIAGGYPPPAQKPRARQVPAATRFTALCLAGDGTWRHDEEVDNGEKPTAQVEPASTTVTASGWASPVHNVETTAAGGAPPPKRRAGWRRASGGHRPWR
jgi:hypothetical protein